MKTHSPLGIVFALLLLAIATFGQFDSGSTGADGALDLTGSNCPLLQPFALNVCEVQIPESGVLNYTTINVPAGKYLRFRRNSRNTSVTLLAQGDVTIGGTVFVINGDYVPCNNPEGRCYEPRLGGPGGFPGGKQGFNGFGPGGGVLGGVQTGVWVGPLSLVPLVGGSGGAGGNHDAYGGGGAILIASSGTIHMAGLIHAGQANLAVLRDWGSGGAIRLVANSIIASGSFIATARPFGGTGGEGVIRLEATNLSFTGTAQPAAVLSTINPEVLPQFIPELRISSVAGRQVPSYAGARFDAVDLLLPRQLSDPISVGVSAVNVPVGTQVTIGFLVGSTASSSSPCSLSGTFSASSCTASISNLDRSGVTYVLATATFDPPGMLAEFNPAGPNQVKKVRIVSNLGSRPEYKFLNANFEEIDPRELSPEFVNHFGIFRD